MGSKAKFKGGLLRPVSLTTGLPVLGAFGSNRIYRSTEQTDAEIDPGAGLILSPDATTGLPGQVEALILPANPASGPLSFTPPPPQSQARPSVTGI